ncbi:RNA polymerase II transcription factor B subunit 5 [Trichodelitschia bisporula]|uniref:General transcription and DNA repair factor IIH subunit TFB5 n=1 Tax=Trichodelitschia bisporula TaxID=703511 RepID=A0A6G1I7N4_9PEZI|nr:RNA polymerase II transcription factor B subunit 5 [Trichodelitschia bisporula]
MPPKATRGVLVQCDESIMAIIRKIDEGRNEFIIEDLDSGTCLVKEGKLAELKRRLKEQLKETVREAEDSESE